MHMKQQSAVRRIEGKIFQIFENTFREKYVSYVLMSRADPRIQKSLVRRES